MSNTVSQENEIVVRPATKEDMDDVVDMIRELADFQKYDIRPTQTAEDYVRDAFETQPPAFYCKVAELKHEKLLIGSAVHYPTYSTWEGKAMKLQSLYVKENYRNQGVGKLLFKAVAKEASQSGCSRLDFHVLEWNPYRQFYDGMGAVNLTHTEKWCFFRLSGDELKNCAA